MANRITEEQIRLINEAYALCHTYSGAAKAAGCSASTAKKYVIEGYVAGAPSIEYAIDVKPVEQLERGNLEFFVKQTSLTNEECKELEEFWKELQL